LQSESLLQLLFASTKSMNTEFNSLQGEQDAPDRTTQTIQTNLTAISGSILLFLRFPVVIFHIKPGPVGILGAVATVGFSEAVGS
jgi:hypothetical protein